MLIKEIHLKGIKEGRITLAFRMWESPRIKAGSLLKTSVGLVEILSIERITERSLTKQAIQRAGFDSLEELQAGFRSSANSELYRISLRYAGEDPRLELRANNEPDYARLQQLQTALDRLDKYSKQGNWTRKVLETIHLNPQKRAVELAALTGFEKEWLKLNIRKLKNLGLTISHSVGYEISPLGLAYLNRMVFLSYFIFFYINQ